MTPGSDDDRSGTEPTFADIMNGFSFDAGRSPRRRRWGRRREAEEPARDTGAVPVPAPAPAPDPASDPIPHPRTEETSVTTAGPPTTPLVIPVVEDNEPAQPSAVRPYTWTRGRTKSGMDLEIETLVSTSQRGRDQIGLLQVEHRAVAELCTETRSVAEVAALLKLPLGVARVLLGDMAGLGVVTVHQTTGSTGSTPDLALMERVLSGLRRL
ncbi:Protein of unknown function [Pseudonocardia thermophila]|jgi:Protein of unknown function (DUF742).|uniref:DUF742 domain-containing protein n=1 Tax=Pseudonocardia thermophila TaxID=1848 RepID=A0A1M6RTF2_PSETH|nr:Protein of unknown function [Pseudonocardia thermophila]